MVMIDEIIESRRDDLQSLLERAGSSSSQPRADVWDNTMWADPIAQPWDDR